MASNSRWQRGHALSSRDDHGAHAALRRSWAQNGAPWPMRAAAGWQKREAMPRATSRPTMLTSMRSTAVNGAPTPALSYCQIPIPGCQNARWYSVYGSLKAYSVWLALWLVVVDNVPFHSS